MGSTDPESSFFCPQLLPPTTEPPTPPTAVHHHPTVHATAATTAATAAAFPAAVAAVAGCGRQNGRHRHGGAYTTFDLTLTFPCMVVTSTVLRNI
nr:hypothetical protein [Tanacetum cinerariifolium]